MQQISLRDKTKGILKKPGHIDAFMAGFFMPNKRGSPDPQDFLSMNEE